MEAKDSKDESEKPLPAKVERALAKAREAASADRKRKGGRWLALIPISIGIVILLFMMPRATPPDGIPLPRADLRVVDAIARTEDKMAAEAESHRLPSDVLLVGTALRDLNIAGDTNDKTLELDARHRIQVTTIDVLNRPNGEQDLLRLRALETRLFLDAIAAWERGSPPKDFAALGGTFVDRAQEAGWVVDHHVLLDENERRIAFKTVWNGVTHLERGNFSLTLDEERALYAFYFQHPHPSESARIAMDNLRRDATTPELCARARREVGRQESLWLVEKIRRLAAIDPKYPGMYALGVAYWHAGRIDLAIDSFNAFIDQHPEGPYALRARNHLKASIAAAAP